MQKRSRLGLNLHRFVWACGGVAILWIVTWLTFEHRLRPLRATNSPAVFSSVGSVTLYGVAGDVILPTSPAADFQFEGVVLSAPSNEGNWRIGVRGLTLLPLSVLTSLAMSRGLVEPPSSVELERITEHATNFLARTTKTPIENLLTIDVRRQVETELLFRAVDRLGQDPSLSALHATYNGLLDTDISKPILIDVRELPHFRNYGIREVVLLPVFNYSGQEPNFSSRSLGDLVRSSVRRGLFRFSNAVGQVAVPALGGTETRPDSHSYLTYRQSFRAILLGIDEAMIDAQLQSRPAPIEKVYLVVWDKLRQRNPGEFEAAREGLLWAAAEHAMTRSRVPLLLTLLMVLLLRDPEGAWRPPRADSIRLLLGALIAVAAYLPGVTGMSSLLTATAKATLVAGGAPLLAAAQAGFIFLCLLATDHGPGVIRRTADLRKRYEERNPR